MDPCPFVRLIVESLALKLPAATKPAGAGVHPSSTPCYAKLKIKNFPSQTALLPLLSATASPPESSTSAAGFHLDPATLRRLSCRPAVTLKISVYTGRMGRSCGVTSGKLLGSLQLSVNLGHAQTRACVYQNGWMKLGSGGEPVAALHLTVRSELLDRDTKITRQTSMQIFSSKDSPNILLGSTNSKTAVLPIMPRRQWEFFL